MCSSPHYQTSVSLLDEQKLPCKKSASGPGMLRDAKTGHEWVDDAENTYGTIK
jgi:hypothetical protein